MLVLKRKEGQKIIISGLKNREIIEVLVAKISRIDRPTITVHAPPNMEVYEEPIERGEMRIVIKNNFVEVVVIVLGVEGNQARIGINAPKDLTINREEINDKSI